MISLVGVPGKSTQVKTFHAKSMIDVSNPVWTLYVGRMLCDWMQHFWVTP